MKQIILTFTLGVLIVVNAFGQRFEKTKADSLRDEGNLELAIEEYANPYQQDSMNRNNTYNYQYHRQNEHKKSAKQRL